MSVPSEIRERGIRDCVTCGRPHDYRSVEAPRPRRATWADPDDGHPYREEEWEVFAERLARRVAVLETVAERAAEYVAACEAVMAFGGSVGQMNASYVALDAALAAAGAATDQGDGT